MSRSVAVLGANGTLGRLICQNLRLGGYTVYAITRKELDLCNSTAVEQWLRANNPDTIVNCATAGGKLTVKDIIYDDVRNNVSIFLNFYNNKALFKKFINVGSGAEFNNLQHIRLAVESDIVTASPTTSYGFSKNLISRIILDTDNFYTVRLFGCFERSEPDFRILKRVLMQDTVLIEDKQFDFISFDDFYKILIHYIDAEIPKYKDINCVYDKKYNLSELVEKFKAINKLMTRIEIADSRGLDYTANGDRLKSLNLDLDGLEKGFESYTHE